MNLTRQCLKVEATKQIVDVKTSLKSSEILNLIKVFRYFQGIDNIMQMKLQKTIIATMFGIHSKKRIMKKQNNIQYTLKYQKIIMTALFFFKNYLFIIFINICI